MTAEDTRAPGGKPGGTAPSPLAHMDVTVEYVQTGEGVPEGGKTGRVSTKERTLDPKMHLTCANPACKKGGFLVRPKVDAMLREGKTASEQTIPCAGYVGQLRTEQGGPDRCGNKLAVKIQLATRGRAG